jgi:CheY-like chemotaxis protein
MIRRRLVSMIADIRGIDAVLQAGDGDEALVLVTAERPDVMVLDIQMRRMGGFQVLDALSQQAATPVVIVLTNHIEYRVHALQKGAAFFFDKATELDALMATLTDLAAGALPLRP